MTIGTGMLHKRGCNKQTAHLQYRMKVLDDHYLDEVMKLQAVIVDRISKKEMLQPFSKNFMQTHFGKKGMVLGIFVENRLIAFRNVYFPDTNDLEWNLGLDLGFPKTECKKIANLQMVCVHPEFRGNNLAFKMNRKAINLIRNQKGIIHLLATVSPYNYWNVHILLQSGFVICALKKKYNSKLRYIVYQNITTSPEIPKNNPHAIGLTDFQKQEKLLQTGFYGYKLREIPVDRDTASGYKNHFFMERERHSKKHEILFSKASESYVKNIQNHG